METNVAGNRYFKRLKLDYPTTETTRASRRFVKAMKRLEVGASLPLKKKNYQTADKDIGNNTD